MPADAIVIGAGYYGCRIALHLRSLGLAKVIVADQSDAIMRRASFANQARVHGGYHYPRSLATGLASRANFARFVREHSHAIQGDIRKIYVIAKDSKVTPSQFEKFCGEIAAPLRPLPRAYSRFFEPTLIAEAYLVEEVVFDSGTVAARILAELAAADVDLRLNVACRIEAPHGGIATVQVGGQSIDAAMVINCTYASLDKVGIPVRSPIRRELAEIAMIALPPEFAQIGVTVMDGPFFSAMPFPPAKCHSLSHVRYTPVAAWSKPHDGSNIPIELGFGRSLNSTAMLRDAARFMPDLRRAKMLGSLFEMKAVLASRESDDGRPILIEVFSESPFIVSVMGGKMDNVYDVLTYLTAALS